MEKYNVGVYGLRGGIGTTATCAIIANVLSESGVTVTIKDAAHNGGFEPMFGVSESFQLYKADAVGEVVLSDCGPISGYPALQNHQNILVVKSDRINRATLSTPKYARYLYKTDLVILLNLGYGFVEREFDYFNENSTLIQSQIEAMSVGGLNVFSLPVDLDVATYVESGLIRYKLPDSLRDLSGSLYEFISPG